MAAQNDDDIDTTKAEKDTTTDNEEVAAAESKDEDLNSCMVENEAYGMSMRQMAIEHKEDEDILYELVV